MSPPLSTHDDHVGRSGGGVGAGDVRGLAGGTLVDAGGDEVGRVEDVYFDQDTNQLEWALVTTGLFGTEQTFVPLADASMSGGDTIQVPFEKATIKDAPRVDAEGELSEDEERVLYRHYGLDYGSSYSDTTSAEGAVTTQAPAAAPPPQPAVEGTTTAPTDDAVTRSEARVRPEKVRRPSQLVRLRKYITAEHATETVPVRREEASGGSAAAAVRAYPLGGGEAEVFSGVARALAPLRGQLEGGVVLVVVPGPDWDDAAVRALRERTAELVGTFGRQVALVEAMAPPVALPGEAAVLQARRNAEARAALLEEFGGLTSAQVADLGGSRAANRSAMAHRWRTEGQIFAVPYRGATLFPGFQFDAGGRPRPVVAEVVRRLGAAVSPWELALWFTTASERLRGARPVDRLDADPGAVVAAAEAVFEPAY